ncbi:MAG: 2-succinyl-5-enolpyruvyl-6-hydroxy-3-cyclohexene-1-carboxylate synthase [Myxococcota bacterium]|nr:2-succinyl-5-enolpyruvyl-6-hydroxy-3-cyclohexene-1-carboxylate synthase [Myxococcota bacterium]
MNTGLLNLLWSQVLFDALSGAGLRRLAISPGSRSTPLVLAALRTSGLRPAVIADERAAAFHVLGMARFSRQPAAFVCTSGTAPAHAYPAIMEASAARIPLLVISADRPPSGQWAGEPQSADQTRLFGGFVRRFADAGIPQPGDDALLGLRRLAMQLLAEASGAHAGPIHLNMPFHKPLEPVEWTPDLEAGLNETRRRIRQRGLQRIFPVQEAAPAEETLQQLRDEIRAHEDGLILCGPADGAAAPADLVERLAGASGYPVYAEAASGVRGAMNGKASGAHAFGALAARGLTPAPDKPPLIIQLGMVPVSSAVQRWLASSGARRMIISSDWANPDGLGNFHIRQSPAGVLKQLVPRLADFRRPAAAWGMELIRRSQLYWAAVSAARRGREALCEAAIARSVQSAIRRCGFVQLGNSRPVRMFDQWTDPDGDSAGGAPRFIHQRGVSGIDGLVSSACGAASVLDGCARGLVILGDVSLSHDLHGLLAAAEQQAPLTILAVNNGGGRIFDELPAARSPLISREDFERCWLTPQPLNIADAARMAGLRHAAALTAHELDAALAEAADAHGPVVLEAIVHDGEETRFREDLQERLDQLFSSTREKP